MKAEERKQNETNILRVWLAHFREKLQNRSFYLIIGLISVLVVACIALVFWRTSVSAANSARVLELYDAMKNDDTALYEKISSSEKHSDKITATLARILIARNVLFTEGFNKLGSPDVAARKAAAAKVEEGRKLFLDVLKELKEQPALQQEAWVNVAHAEEALLGTPVSDGSSEMKGSMDRLVEYYTNAAKIEPQSDASKKYEAPSQNRVRCLQKIACS